MLADAFAEIAMMVSDGFVGPYHDAVVRWSGTPVMSGGSIVSPGTPVAKTCKAQVDKVTDRMRLAEGYTDKDVGLFVLVASLDAVMNTSAQIEVTAGPHAGRYMVDMVDRDPMAVCWQCRGRPA